MTLILQQISSHSRRAAALLQGLLLLLLCLAPVTFSHADTWLLDLEGPIGPASADYILRSLAKADQAEADLVVIRIDTPGGLDMAMRDIVSAILASPVPVASWTAPGGARAASAGTYIMMASHFAAMAPATNIGSSTPVNLGGSAPAADPEGERPGTSSAGERKAINDAVAYLRSLAELRGRNSQWAEATVRQASNLPASEALQENVIDLIARDMDELLAGLDGRSTQIAGQAHVLTLQNTQVVALTPDWRHDFLSVITNPNIAYILLMIGVYGLILEFYNPGLGIPGVTGIICLLVAAFALQMLPISYAGLALMGVGIGLLVFEMISPSFGVAGLGGLVAFVLGSIMLMDTELPAYQISLPLIAAVAVASAGFILFLLGALLRARQQPVTTGTEAMIGSEVRAIEDFETRGLVFVHGETWTADSNVPLRRNDRATITQVQGLILKVTKKE